MANSTKFTLDRISGSVFRRLRYPIDRYFSRRHPNGLERWLIRMLGPLLVRLAPNDRWSLGVHGPAWARAATLDRDSIRAEKPLRIFLWTAYRGQFTLDISLAAMLAAMGHRVTVGYVPKLGSPIKDPLVDHPSAAAYLADALGGIETASGGRISIVCLSEFGAPEGHVTPPEFLEQQSRADAIMRLGVETIDAGNPKHADALDYYQRLGENADRFANGFFAARSGEFDLVLVANGMTSESAWIIRAAQVYGIEITTFEKFAFRHTRIISHGSGVFSFSDLDRMWKNRVALGYTREPFLSRATAKAHSILDERRRASTQNWAWKYQFAPDQSDDDAVAAIGLPADKPFILVCTNVPFDAGYYQFTTLFPSMKSWLLETVSFLLRETECNIVVRIHPGEAMHFAGREFSLDNLTAAGFSNNSRLKIVGPKDPVNTYPLMAKCQAGVVFSSTTGIEMAMMGRPVIVGADVYFAGRGLTQDCPTRDVYFETLRKYAAIRTMIDKDAAISQNAALLYFLVHYVLQIPYPYDKPDDLRTMPPASLIGSSLFNKYVPFLELAAAIKDGIDPAFTAHLSAEKIEARVRW